MPLGLPLPAEDAIALCAASRPVVSAVLTLARLSWRTLGRLCLAVVTLQRRQRLAVPAHSASDRPPACHPLLLGRGRRCGLLRCGH